MTKRTIIIAEAGVNHNGKISIAKKLILAAKKTGADYVKFQLYDPDEMVTQKALAASYQKKNTGNRFLNQYSLLKSLVLDQDQILKLYEYAKHAKIGFLLSVFDLKSAQIFKRLKLDFIKIPSGEITNLPLLLELKKFKTPFIISTGMSKFSEVNKIKEKLKLKNKTIYLHCVSSYPSKPKDLNLKMIQILKRKLKSAVGLSDHSKGIEAAVASVALGAEVIEKHITLNTNLKGPDHSSSLDPIDFKKMVLSIRRVEEMIKFNSSLISRSEKHNLKIVRKSIVAKRDIKKGDKFTRFNLSVKRPGKGISPMNWFKVLNKKAKKNFKKDEMIN